MNEQTNKAHYVNKHEEQNSSDCGLQFCTGIFFRIYES